MKAKVSCILANGVGTENSVIIKNDDTRQIYKIYLELWDKFPNLIRAKYKLEFDLSVKGLNN